MYQNRLGLYVHRRDRYVDVLFDDVVDCVCCCEETCARAWNYSVLPVDIGSVFIAIFFQDQEFHS